MIRTLTAMAVVAVVAVVGSALTLTACSAVVPKPSMPCLTVPATKLSAIASGARPGITDLKLTTGRAIRDPESRLYLIAARMSAAGDGKIGVWASPGFDPVNATLSVDALAQRFTTWPDAAKSGPRIAADDKNVRLARDCLGA